jgi:hypothetical protein
MWERAVVSGHRADIVARNNVHHHHVFWYERHKRALMHPRGSFLLRVTRSVHDALEVQRNGSRGGDCAVGGIRFGRRRARRYPSGSGAGHLEAEPAGNRVVPPSGSRSPNTPRARSPSPPRPNPQ